MGEDLELGCICIGNVLIMVTVSLKRKYSIKHDFKKVYLNLLKTKLGRLLREHVEEYLQPWRLKIQ